MTKNETAYALVERVLNYEDNGSVDVNVIGVSDNLDTIRQLMEEMSSSRINKLLDDYDKSELDIDTHNPDYRSISENNNDYRWEYEIRLTKFY